MKAYVVSAPGGPEVLQLKEIPDPVPQKGQALIEIKAFGLNRAEVATRLGDSGKNVLFPRVIGIECVGKVLACPGGELKAGQTVAAAMGEMGRKYDGSYAEKTVVPVTNVFPIETNLDWTTFAAIPETYFTAWGICFEGLQLKTKPRVVVRPGASALGIAITQIVNHMGGKVIGVTRSPHKVNKLLKAGMYKVLVSGMTVADPVLELWPDGASGILDTIVSEVTLEDDFKMKAKGAKICLAGSLADTYGSDKPIQLSKAVQLTRSNPAVTFYNSGVISVEKNGQSIQEIVSRVEQGIYQPHIAAVYNFEDLPKAHKGMDKNAFAGKVVVSVL